MLYFLELAAARRRILVYNSSTALALTLGLRQRFLLEFSTHFLHLRLVFSAKSPAFRRLYHRPVMPFHSLPVRITFEYTLLSFRRPVLTCGPYLMWHIVAYNTKYILHSYFSPRECRCWVNAPLKPCCTLGARLWRRVMSIFGFWTCGRGARVSSVGLGFN